jgi:hypothetical protein
MNISLGCRCEPLQLQIRWAAKGHGKRGGARVIYFWRTTQGQIILARLCAKN